jgi:hypothetical protein
VTPAMIEAGVVVIYDSGAIEHPFRKRTGCSLGKYFERWQRVVNFGCQKSYDLDKS